MKIGLFFGTFNPIHVGHLIIANHMADFTDLDEVWMVVTPHNPLKKKSSLLADHHRFQLVQEATEDFPKIKPSNVEFDLPQPNYTVHTLALLEEKYPQHDFCLIMGEDNLRSLKKWKNYELILERHKIYVYPRLTTLEKDPELENLEAIEFTDAPVVEISSSFIRKAIAEGKSVRALMPHRAWDYLDRMNFYR